MQIICDDGNDNIALITELINRIVDSTKVDEWIISEFDAVPIYFGDLSGCGYTWELPSQKLYKLRQRLMDEDVVTLRHMDFMSLLSCLRCIYNADIVFVALGYKNKITVFEGTIIDISGFAENVI